MNKRQIGNEWEEKACQYLEENNLVVLERNYRVKIGEIDIIAKDGDTLVFIEVKYRSRRDYGGAFFAISPAKQKKIYRVAEWYMMEKHLPRNMNCRFDAVLIDGNVVNHIKNAW